MPAKIAINGFGRIGRAAFKILLDRENVEVAAINDLTDAKTLVYLLKYDSVYGRYEREVSLDGDNIVVDGKRTKLLSIKDPTQLPWRDMGVDVVLECTGVFEKDGACRKHIEAGARKVVLSAPAKGEGDVQTFLRGVNEEQAVDKDAISNASCTTNSITPVMDIVDKAIGIKKAAMTTVHAVTATQNLIDGPHKDLRRARAAIGNIIPTTTGAADATTKLMPSLEGKFDGVSMRVPVLCGSLSDITMLLNRSTSVEEINDLFKKAAEDPKYKGIVGVTEDAWVSSDIVKTSYSSVVDLSLTKVVDGDFVKVFAWYDNEWGYSHRLVDMALLLASH